MWKKCDICSRIKRWKLTGNSFWWKFLVKVSGESFWWKFLVKALGDNFWWKFLIKVFKKVSCEGYGWSLWWHTCTRTNLYHQAQVLGGPSHSPLPLPMPPGHTSLHSTPDFSLISFLAIKKLHLACLKQQVWSVSDHLLHESVRLLFQCNASMHPTQLLGSKCQAAGCGGRK